MMMCLRGWVLASCMHAPPYTACIYTPHNMYRLCVKYIPENIIVQYINSLGASDNIIEGVAVVNSSSKIDY